MNKTNLLKRLLCFVLTVWSVSVWCQVSIDLSGYGVKVQTGKAGGERVDINGGEVSSDVEMEGVAVINGAVFVDGEKVPAGKTEVRSKKSGKTYLIRRGKDGNVSISEK